MVAVNWLLLLAGAYPLWRCWMKHHATSLRHAVLWLFGAWLAWAGVALRVIGPGSEPARYLALSFTACAVVAVLGARRPGVAAWNFVVLGLLAVLLLPLAESVVTGEPPLNGLRTFFLAATLGVGVL